MSKFSLKLTPPISTAPVKYKLKSNDGQIFLVDRCAVKASAIINQAIIDNGWTDRNCHDMVPIPISFPAAVLERIIEWLDHHKDDTNTDEKLTFMKFPPWDKQFFRMEPTPLFHVLNASHVLGIDEMMNMGCCAAAELIRGKTTTEIRRIYNLKEDERREREDGGAGPSGFEDDENYGGEGSVEQKPKSSKHKAHKKSKKPKKKRH